MSKYTTEVRFICETEANLTESKGFDDINTIITTAAPSVFNFDFPIFDETYRLPLETKILRHFYTREICEETVGLWKLRLQDKLCTIMPYYNKLYESELLSFNPLYDVDYNREYDKGSDEESTGTSVQQVNENSTNKTTNEDVRSDITVTNGSRNEDNTKESVTNRAYASNDSSTSRREDTGNDSNLHWDLYSDTPQGGVNGIEPPLVHDPTSTGDTVADNYYLTNARKITDSGTNHNVSVGTQSGENNVNEGVAVNDVYDNNSVYSQNVNNATSKSGVVDSANQFSRDKTGATSGTVKNTEEYVEHVFGKRTMISYSKLLLEFRETFLNIDAMILKELEPLFFGLWA